MRTDMTHAQELDTAQADWMETEAAADFVHALEYEALEYEVISLPATRTYRRDSEEWWLRMEYRSGRMAAWAYYKRQDISWLGMKHSAHWSAGFESIRAALHMRWRVQLARLEAELNAAHDHLSQARYAYWNLKAIGWGELELAYQRMGDATDAVCSHQWRKYYLI